MLIAANWKMYKGPGETRAFLAEFAPPEVVDVVICPPFGSLGAAVASGRTIFAQNVHWASEGAFTGEVSTRILLELGVQGAIVGHSERRQYFGETDETVARRVAAALEHGLRVIACVGESLEERESGQMELVLRVQVEAIADAAGAHAGLVLAYEPVWAIGTGRTASPEQAQEAHAFIKSLLDDVLSELDPDRRRILADRLRACGQALVTSASRNALPGEPAQTVTVEQGHDGASRAEAA